MHIHEYLQLVYHNEQQLAKAFSKVARLHQNEPEIYYMCLMLAMWSIEHARDVLPFKKKYTWPESSTTATERLNPAISDDPQNGELNLLHDLHGLWLQTKEIEICWSVLLQAAKTIRDEELETACASMAKETKRQSDWLISRVKKAAPQILVVTD
jgi:hypothetical protein